MILREMIDFREFDHFWAFVVILYGVRYFVSRLLSVVLEIRYSSLGLVLRGIFGAWIV